MTSSSNKKVYFTAGPAKIPDEVMLKVREELFDYKGMNIGVMDMSHRSKEFAAIIEETEAILRK
jgi:phosphoserine aminotransferase